jgi:hypothetical protein
MELARIYARHACWADMTTWRPREDICAEIGSPRDRSRPLSVTAYRAARRWLQAHGYLGLVTPGWTSMLRASVLDDGEQLCPVYVLAIPRTPKTRHIPPPRLPAPPANRALTTSRSVVVKAPAHARGHPQDDQDQNQDGPRCARAAQPPAPAEVVPMSKTQKRSEARAAAAVILKQCRPLQPLTTEHAAAVIRPWTTAGWAPGDLLWAITHQPPDATGRCRPHGWTDGVRHPAAWLRWRLAQWTSPSGAPLTAPSRRNAAERAAARGAQAARRAERTRPDGGAAQHARRAERQARGQAPTLRDILTRTRQATSHPLTSPPHAQTGVWDGRPTAPAPAEAALPASLPTQAVTAVTAAAYWRDALLARLPDAAALARAQRHLTSTSSGHATTARDQVAPLTARADAAQAQATRRQREPGPAAGTTGPSG